MKTQRCGIVFTVGLLVTLLQLAPMTMMIYD